MVVFPISVLILTFIINRNILKKNYRIFNPVSILIYIWGVQYIFHFLNFSISKNTWKIYLFTSLGVLAAAIGFWLFYNKRIVLRKKYNEEKKLDYNMKFMEKLIKIGIVLNSLKLFYTIYLVVFKLAKSWGIFFNANTYVRRLYLNYNGSITENIMLFSVNAMVLISYVLIGIYSAKKEKRYKLYFSVFTIIEILNAVFSMSKMCLFLYVIVVSVTVLNYMDSIKNQIRKIFKYLPIIVLGLFAFLIFIGNQRNYGHDNNKNLVVVVANKASGYFCGPLEGIIKYTEKYESNYNFGSATFKSFSRVLSRMNLIENKKVLEHAEYIEIGNGIQTNAYTWYRNFYDDFSYMGLIIMPFVLGIISGLLYDENHNLFSDVSYAWVCAVFFMSFYAFLWGQTVYIVVLILSYIFNKVFKELYV